MRLCGLLGHKWGPGEYEQNCQRKNCMAWRAVYVKKFPKFQEPASGWEVFDIQKLKF